MRTPETYPAIESTIVSLSILIQGREMKNLEVLFSLLADEIITSWIL